jgi:hypothetical protein
MGHPGPEPPSASLAVQVATCRLVTIDVQALLRRVVAEVFGADVGATYSTEPTDPGMHRVRLTSADGQRHAGLRASHEWFDADIFDLGVSTFLLDYDDAEENKEAVLRDLALVVRAYLRGEGRVERRCGLIRSHSVLRIVVDGQEWVLRPSRSVGILGRSRRLRFYRDCPSCGHDWREHPGTPAIDGSECGECVYELEHGERPEDAGPLCTRRAPAPAGGL